LRRVRERREDALAAEGFDLEAHGRDARRHLVAALEATTGEGATS
jgi:hypothetical protein